MTVENRHFVDITEVTAYLRRLSKADDDLLVAIAVKDTPGINLTEEISELIQNLGFESSLRKKSRCAFVGAVHGGEVLFEDLSERDGSLSQRMRVDKTMVQVESAGFGGGNRARIIIDAIDYAINMRGLNIVVYDLAGRDVIDSVAFDTHLRAHPSRRIETALAQQMDRIERLLGRLERKEEKIQAMLEKAEKRRLEDVKARKLNYSRVQMMLWHALPNQETDVEAAKRSFFQSLPKASGALRKVHAANLVMLREFDRVMKENNIPYWLSFGSLLGGFRTGEFIPWDDDADICVMRSELPRIRQAFEDHEFLWFDQFYWLHKAGNANMDVRYKIRFKEPGPLFIDIFAMDYSEVMNQQIVDQTRAIKLEMSRKARRFYQAKYPDTYADTRMYHDEEFGPMFDDARAQITELYGDASTQNFVMWGIDNVPTRVGFRTFFPTDWVFPLGEIELYGQKFPAPREPMRYLSKLYGDPWALPEDMFSHKHFSIGPVGEKTLDRLLEAYADWLEGFDLDGIVNIDIDETEEV